VQVVGEAAEPLGVGVGGVGAEGIGQVPAPAQLVGRREDLARGVERGKDGLAPRNPPFEIHRRFPEGGLRCASDIWVSVRLLRGAPNPPYRAPFVPSLPSS
jgi:hypothetical protein